MFTFHISFSEVYQRINKSEDFFLNLFNKYEKNKINFTWTNFCSFCETIIDSLMNNFVVIKCKGWDKKEKHSTENLNP